MHRITLLAVSATVMSHVANADIVRSGSFPERYTGTWVADAGTAPDNPVIVLSAKMYFSSQATCSAVWVSQTASARGSIYSAHLQCLKLAEGGENKTMANLIIWPETVNRIAVGSEFTSLKIYHRCSATCESQRNNLVAGGVSDESQPHLVPKVGSNVGKCAQGC
jgi:hypothetical protein